MSDWLKDKESFEKAVGPEIATKINKDTNEISEIVIHGVPRKCIRCDMRIKCEQLYKDATYRYAHCHIKEI